MPRSIKIAEKHRKVLVAPIGVTATKPFMPSHLKGLLWVDVLQRATARFHEADLFYSHRAGYTSLQTLGFWEYLDRSQPGADFSSWTEETIGELYVKYQSGSSRAAYSAIRPYKEAYDSEEWIHPASIRIAEIWSEHFRLLGAHDPGIRPAKRSKGELSVLIEALATRGLWLDMRTSGGGGYLDGTLYGMPLRPAVSADGHSNYLIGFLLDLLPYVCEYDEIVLIHDQELHSDFTLLQRIVDALGGRATRISLGRVALSGSIQSSRYGGWNGVTVSDIAKLCLNEVDVPAFRLGLRLYFISTLGISSAQSFDTRLLLRRMRHARTLIARAGESPAPDLTHLFGAYQPHHYYVDPFKLTSSILNRKQGGPSKNLLESVYL